VHHIFLVFEGDKSNSKIGVFTVSLNGFDLCVYLLDLGSEEVFSVDLSLVALEA